MPEELTLENPVAIIGDEDIVSGFKAIGFKVYSPKEPDDFRKILDNIASEKTAVCLVQDNIYKAQESYIKYYENSAFPVFIPFSKDAKSLLLDNIVRKIRLRATGAF